MVGDGLFYVVYSYFRRTSKNNFSFFLLFCFLNSSSFSTPSTFSVMGWEEVDKAISMCRCAIHGADSTGLRGARALISVRASARGCVCQLPFTRPARGQRVRDGRRQEEALYHAMRPHNLRDVQGQQLPQPADGQVRRRPPHTAGLHRSRKPLAAAMPRLRALNHKP